MVIIWSEFEKALTGLTCQGFGIYEYLALLSRMGLPDGSDYSTLEINATTTPKAPQEKLTQSLFSHFHPRMWTVGVPQV
jgi:hypothetical protein